MPRSHARAVSSARMGWSVALTLAFVAVEAVAGWRANSVALLSDAGHNFADAAALSLSWYALWAARGQSHARMTFGYHRVGILAALVNAATLIAIAFWIFWEAVERLLYPREVKSGLMIGVAAVAVVLNVVISLWLGGGKHDLNVRSAYLHMVGDALSALGVVVAGFIVAVTHAWRVDPVVSFLIGGFILWSSWGILKESVNVLLEGTPVGMDMTQVEKAIKGVPDVLNAHDLHVWTLSSGLIACSCHIVVAEQTVRSGQQVLRAVVEELTRRFEIAHTTIQVEVEGCGPNEIYCTLRAAHAGHGAEEGT